MSKSKKKKNKKRLSKKLNGILSIIGGLSNNEQLKKLVDNEKKHSDEAAEHLLTIRELFHERNEALDDFNSLLWNVAAEYEDDIDDKVLDADVRLIGIEEKLVKAMKLLSEASSESRYSRFALCEKIREATGQGIKNDKSTAK